MTAAEFILNVFGPIIATRGKWKLRAKEGIFHLEGPKHIDYPILLDNDRGIVAFDFPERVPQTIQRTVCKAILKYKRTTKIEKLWESILSYACSHGNIMGEGNSGEFHKESERKKYEEEMRTNREKLIVYFEDVTGYKLTYKKIFESVFDEWEEIDSRNWELIKTTT